MEWISIQTIDTPWVASVGWALIHSLWQIALVAIVYGGLKMACRKNGKAANSQFLYLSGCIAMFAMIALPVATLGIMLNQSPQHSTVSSNAPSAPHSLTPSNSSQLGELLALTGEQTPVDMAQNQLAAEPIPAPTESEESRSNPSSSLYLWLVVLSWSMGVCLFSIRPIVGMLHVRKLAKHDIQPLAKSWQSIATEIAQKLKITKAVELVESARVQVPTVVGYLKPIVLIPAAALTGLNQQQMTLILAHELAHIRRHDFLINFAQTIVETLMFYHPAVWWLSSQIRIERENCCDDIAVQVEGSPTSLAHALLALEESRTSAPALAATGGSLSGRVKRLLNIQSTKQPPFVGMATLAIAGLISSLAISSAIGHGIHPQDLDQVAVEEQSPDKPDLNDSTDSASNFDNSTSPAGRANPPVRQLAQEPRPEPAADLLVIVTSSREAAENYRELALANPTEEYFKELASKFSEDEVTRKTGGAVPPIRRRGVRPEAEETAFALRRGAISKVVPIDDRFIVMYGLGIRDAEYVDPATDMTQVQVTSYCVADLVVSPSAFTTTVQVPTEKKIDAQNLIDLIKKEIEPDTWKHHTILFQKENLSLIVSTERGIHSQIQDLLSKLRELSAVLIETRGYLIQLPQKELQQFSQFREKFGDDPTPLSMREAATLNAIAVAKDSIQLQDLPTSVLFNGQTLKVDIDNGEGTQAPQIALQQVVNPERDAVRTSLLVFGQDLRANKPQVFNCKSGQLMAVDFSKMLNLDPKKQRAILVFKSVIAQDVE